MTASTSGTGAPVSFVHSQPPAPVRAAAERLIAALAEDETFGGWLAQAVIDSKVRNGDLIPAERLRFSGGLELVPAGRVAELETVIGRALSHLHLGEDVAARDALLSVAAPSYQPATNGTTTKAKPAAKRAKKVAAKKAPARRAKTSVAPAAEPASTATEPDGRPEGMPVAGQTYLCEECGTQIDGAEAQMPWIRFRRTLCKDDFRKATA